MTGDVTGDLTGAANNATLVNIESLDVNNFRPSYSRETEVILPPLMVVFLPPLLTIRGFNHRWKITAPGGVVANLTGNVTGNLTGDVTGNVTGNVTGVSTGQNRVKLAQVTEHPDKSSLLVGLTQNMTPLRLTVNPLS